MLPTPASTLEKIKHNQLFKGRVMKFKPNEQLVKSNKLLGELDFDFSIKDYLARGKWTKLTCL